MVIKILQVSVVKVKQTVLNGQLHLLQFLISCSSLNMYQKLWKLVCSRQSYCNNN